MWTADWSHELLNHLRRAEQPTLRLLRHLRDGGHFENSVVFLLADHGFRNGMNMETTIGKHETSLPFLIVVFPGERS
jgi:membrane-anchored protein YejM (alkaline phosphatase superfamily)